MRFVKYVSSAAPGSRWDIAAEYALVAEEDGGEEDAGEKGGAGGQEVMKIKLKRRKT
jgi:hypothetical protein